MPRGVFCKQSLLPEHVHILSHCKASARRHALHHLLDNDTDLLTDSEQGCTELLLGASDLRDQVVTCWVINKVASAAWCAARF